MGFPGGAAVKRPPAICRRHTFSPAVGKAPWRWKWHPTPVFLPAESHGQRSLAGYSPRGRKQSDTTEQLKQQGCLPEAAQLLTQAAEVFKMFMLTAFQFPTFSRPSVSKKKANYAMKENKNTHNIKYESCPANPTERR